MLPNLYIKPLRIAGPLEIEPFGLLVGIAVLVGYALARRRARRAGLDPAICGDAMIWGLVGGFAVAHWVAVIFYFPERIVEDPLALVKFWDGLSSFGGFVGGFLGVFLCLRRRGVSLIDYTEAILFGFVPAWILGRLGCTIVFDHPGTTTEFFLGMADRSGVVRHNLGFYEMLWAVGLTVTLYAVKNRRPFPGFHLVLMILAYTPVRFVFDFLRVADKTYLGLTAGQVFCVALFGVAVAMMVLGARRRRPDEPGDPA